MEISIGTFNLNNLFSRFNFQGAIDMIQQSDGAAAVFAIRYESTDSASYRIRTFLGHASKKTTKVCIQRIGLHMHRASALVGKRLGLYEAS